MRLGSPCAVALALLLSACASAPLPRLASSTPPVPQDQGRVVDLVPSPSWPIRWTAAAPQSLGPAAPVAWQAPANGVADNVATEKPQSLPLLPLPTVSPLPVKEAPTSRSWTTVTQAKPVANLPQPTPVVTKAKSTATDTDAKPKTTVAAKPAPVVAPKATTTPTAAATASLLPGDEASAADFQWQDVNATAGDLVTLHFDKTNWLYLDSPAQQKTLGFQAITRDKDATTFSFKPAIPGQYTLEFQRQDLTNQSTDQRKVKLTVAKSGTRTTSTGTSLSPQVSTTVANDALEASRQLAAAGKTAEAVQRLLQSYKADDARLNLELGRLLNQSGQDDEALSYLDKNLTLTGPDLQSTLELGTKLATTRDPQKKLPTYVKLWTGGALTPSEDLYLTVFEALRTQKLTTQLKDWASHYAAWYPAPKSKDRYLFQLGQWLEEPGDARDVRGSWKAYNEVVQSYPLSPYWKSAGERAAYINRHFLQAR